MKSYVIDEIIFQLVIIPSVLKKITKQQCLIYDTYQYVSLMSETRTILTVDIDCAV